MELENVLYGGVQIAHNFGAAAVTGLPIAALWLVPAPPTLRKMAWLNLFAWLVQAASGAGFGTVSYYTEDQLPEIHHLALTALCVKIACAVLAIALLAIHFARPAVAAPGTAIWRGLAVLGCGRLSHGQARRIRERIQSAKATAAGRARTRSVSLVKWTREAGPLGWLV